MKRKPLDQTEGPTLWIEIEDIDTAEQQHVYLKEGTDPDDPFNEVLLNQQEAQEALNFLDDTLES